LSDINVKACECEVNWQDHISNNEVRRQMQREWTHPAISAECQTMTAKVMVFGMVEGERRPRRPVWRWIDDILTWCGQDVQKAGLMTVDREEIYG